MTEEVSYGRKVYDDKGVLLGYEAGKTDEGFIYKDEKAFLNCPDEICYIPEYAFEGEIMPPEDAKKFGYTAADIRRMVREQYGEEYMLTEEQIAFYAEDIFYLAEWAHIETYLQDAPIWDAIECDDERGNGHFTDFQKEAIAHNMTPLEWKKFNIKK